MRFRRVPALAATVLLSGALLAPCAGAQVRVDAPGAGPFTVKVMSWREIPFRTVVRQAYDYSCGSAAVATLLTHHYGRPTSEADVFRVMYARGDQERIRQVGFSMLDMKGFLKTEGLAADGFRMSLDELAAADTPAIALIDLGRYRHFVVIKGVQGGRVLVGDPALGLKTYARPEFEKMWNGIVFAIHPDPAKNPAFNLAGEWRPWAKAPLSADQASSVAALTRDLPPLYQITPVGGSPQPSGTAP